MKKYGIIFNSICIIFKIITGEVHDRPVEILRKIPISAI